MHHIRQNISDVLSFKGFISLPTAAGLLPLFVVGFLLVSLTHVGEMKKSSAHVLVN